MVSQIFVSLVTDLPNEPLRTQGVAGSIPLEEQKFAPFSFFHNLPFLKNLLFSLPFVLMNEFEYLI